MKPREHDRGHGDLIVSYNALLRAYCQCHGLREAEAAYGSMRHKNLSPTLTTMNTLMSGYAKVHTPPLVNDIRCISHAHSG